MSTDAERLEKLNAYLISKGRKPKTLQPIDFVKRNIAITNSAKRKGSTSVLSDSTNKRHLLQQNKVSMADYGALTVSGLLDTSENNAIPVESDFLLEESDCREYTSLTDVTDVSPIKDPVVEITDLDPEKKHDTSTATPKNTVTALSLKAKKQPIRSSKNQKSVSTPNQKFDRENVSKALPPKEIQTPNRHQSKTKTERTPKHKTPVRSANESMRKRLVRRSINIVATKGQNHTPKTPSKTPLKNRHMLTPVAGRINKSGIKNKLQCKSAGPVLKRASKFRGAKSKQEHEQTMLHDKLNRWLIAKGKKPLDGQKLRGFKPTKTIATPVGSPAGTPKQKTKAGSHWQGLRDEDDTDELTILIQNTMHDVQKCIKEGCSASAIRQTLDELAETLPKVKSHAKFWVTLAQLEQYAGKTDQEICDLFEQAIIAKAQPIQDIQEAINSLVLQKIEEPKKLEKRLTFLETSLENSDIDVSPQCHKAVPTQQVMTPNPMVSKLIDCERPILKNAATSPIIFESPKCPTDQLMTPDSPSSVVKLRMVSRSSPVFKRLKSLRTLPDDASAIITPVRRSCRIAATHDNYPKSLQDHEPCLSTVHEIFPALKHQQNPAKDHNDNVSCDIVFDPNRALGDDFADISTVLKF